MKLFLLLCMLLISAAGNATSQTSFDKIGEAVQLMDNGAIGKSIVILHEVLEKEPDSYLAQYELGYAHFLNKNYQLSIDIYKQLRNHPDCEFLVYHMLGKLYERTNDRAKAFESYQDGKNSPRASFSSMNLAIFLSTNRNTTMRLLIIGQA